MFAQVPYRRHFDDSSGWSSWNRSVSDGGRRFELICLPNGAVRINPLPYKIVQRPEMIVQFWEANTHSYRSWSLERGAHDRRPEGVDETIHLQPRFHARSCWELQECLSGNFGWRL
jgi:hypothetical protein